MSHIIRTTTAIYIIETFTCKAWRYIFTHSTVLIPALKLTKWKLLLHRSEVTYIELLLSFYYEFLEYVVILFPEAVRKVCSIYATVLIRTEVPGQIHTFAKMVA